MQKQIQVFLLWLRLVIFFTMRKKKVLFDTYICLSTQKNLEKRVRCNYNHFSVSEIQKVKIIIVERIWPIPATVPSNYRPYKY